MKTIIFYQIFFKNKDEYPLKISLEGYEKLKLKLTEAIPPKFVSIKGRLIATNEIAQVVGVEGHQNISK